MPRRPFALAPFLLLTFLTAVTARAESPGQRELARGREAFAQRDYTAAAGHLKAATAALDPKRERQALAEAWLQLGVAELTGLDHAAAALAAFQKSAALAADPSSAWLWASTAAEKLGRAADAAAYNARALEPPPLPARSADSVAPPAPAPPAAKAPEATAPPSAFQHFFGPRPRRSAPTPPAAGPAAAPPAPAMPQPAVPETDRGPAPTPAPGDSFQALFGENHVDCPAAARDAQAKGVDARARKKAGKEKAAAKKRKEGVNEKQLDSGDGGQTGEKPVDGSAPPR